MGALGNVYIKEEILETLLKTIRAKKEKGLSITSSGKTFQPLQLKQKSKEKLRQKSTTLVTVQ
jgi:DNA repair photolyase